MALAFKWHSKRQIKITDLHSDLHKLYFLLCRPKRKLLLSEAQKQNPSKQKNLPVNEHRLEKRQKQIDFGKNTLAYGRYIAAVKR